jgi:hypothetical protein
MNRQTLSTNGGHPLTGDDLQYNINNIVANTVGVMSWLKGLTSNDIVILSGCVITESVGSYTHTEGYIWYNGEVLYVPAKVVASGIAVGPPDPTYSLAVVETTDATGTKVYKNLASVDTRFTRVGRIDSVIGVVATTFTNHNYWEAIRRDVGTGVEPAYSAGWSGTVNVRKKLGKIEFDGSAAIASMGGGDRVIWNLAAADRPATDKHFVIKGLDNSVDAVIMIDVTSGGDVRVIGGATGVPKTVNLNSISFYQT